MEKIKFKIKIQNCLPHKFNGLDEEKRLKEMPEKDQAEAHIYRCDNGNIGIPADWIRGSFIAEWVARAAKKGKRDAKQYVAPRVRVAPEIMDTGQETYEVYKTSVPAGNISRGGVRDICIRPLIRECEVEGELYVSLNESVKDVQKILELALENQGVGSNRVNGFGRGIVSFP